MAIRRGHRVRDRTPGRASAQLSRPGRGRPHPRRHRRRPMMVPAGGDHRPLLLVEDDDDVRDAIAGSLRDEGYVVAEAGNGRLALEWLQRNADPCLVLLDLWMPVMSGMELREKMAQDPRLAAVPLVVVTAAGDGKARAEEMGAIGYLRKPLDLKDLLATVERYC